MINTINEAINRKLNSISFTEIVSGVVESIKPLKIRLSDKIVIGENFIEPMSLGIDDSSPSSPLNLIVGEKVQMIRYHRGQRYYLLKSNNDLDFDKIYPIGTMYQNYNDINPAEYFGLEWAFIGTQEIGGITIYNWVRVDTGDKILLEDGKSYLLLENGGKILWR